MGEELVQLMFNKLSEWRCYMGGRAKMGCGWQGMNLGIFNDSSVGSRVIDTWVRGAVLQLTSYMTLGRFLHLSKSQFYLLQYRNSNSTYPIELLWRFKREYMQSTVPGIWPVFDVGSYSSQSTPSCFFISDYKDRRKSKPEFYCKQIETREITFRLDKRKHHACQWSSFPLYNNTTHPKDIFSFLEM